MSYIVLPSAVLSYPNLFVAKAPPKSATAKYSCNLIFPEGTNLESIKQQIMQCAQAKWGNAMPANLQLPLKWAANTSKANDPNYAGKFFMSTSARTEHPPQVIDEQKMPVDAQRGALLMYPGCMVVAAVRFYAYSNMGNNGVGCGLQAVMRVGDGVRIGESLDVQQAFANVAPLVQPNAFAPAAIAGGQLPAQSQQPAGQTFNW